MNRLGAIFVTVLALAAPGFAQDAQALLERARLGATLQHNDLKGSIRTGRERADVALFMRGEDIQFQFSKNGGPWQAFHMRLGDDQFDLFEFVNREQKRFPREKLVQPVAGSDLTYEDLSMRFLYWPGARVEGEERVKGFDCWKLRVDNPGKSGAYRTMYVWIHKEFGAFMKVEGFDRNGRKLKRFQVDDVMKLPDGSYTLRKMEVASYDERERVESRSQLRFDPPEKRKPKGPR